MCSSDLLLGCIALLAASAASAADMQVAKAQPAANTWQGFYIGAHVGYGFGDITAFREVSFDTKGLVGGGQVGSAACSVIAKASGYIFDGFRGKSNPWADCLGTPAMGACVADKWHYWTTGVMVDDYKVGIADSKKQPDQKYYNDVCWCWRK